MRSAVLRAKAKEACGHAKQLSRWAVILPAGQTVRLRSTVPLSPACLAAKRAAMVLDGYYEIFKGNHDTRDWTDDNPRQNKVKIIREPESKIFSNWLDALILEQAEAWRPMTPVERAKRFPNAMWALVGDCTEYQNISDAKNTPRNAWTKLQVEVPLRLTGNASKEEQTSAHSLSVLLPGTNKFNYGDDHITSSGIGNETMKIKILPWRQYAQERQLVQDLAKMTGLMILWIPPVAGWIPTILSIVAPRQAFSRHFHNGYEVVQFTLIEQKEQRVPVDVVVRDCLSFKYSSLLDSLKMHFTSRDNDGGGFTTNKVNDPVGLYKALFESSSIFKESRLGSHSGELDQLPGKYIHNLAKTVGLSGFLTPASVLRPKLRIALATIAEDDAQLLMENHDNTECIMLSDREVLDSCLMRNLTIVLSSCLENGPEAVDYDEMRKSLTEHLRCIRLVSEHVVHQIPKVDGVHGYFVEAEMAKEKMGLFAAHLSILRHYYSKQEMGSGEEDNRQSAPWSLLS